jgi:DNA-binding NarL/FixJ family response regulator
MSNAPVKRILCIEDDRETSALIAEDLRERGFEVLCAFGGEEGFAAILRSHPDLVLCDVSMPGITGFEVLSRLSQLSPRIALTPFVFLTALADRDSQLQGRQLGADDYITKPIDFDLLAAIVQNRLGQSARSSAASDRVELTEREIEVLTWSARGKTSHEMAQILSLSKRTVDFHIENARQKLGVATRVEAAVKAAIDRLIEP